MRVLLVTPASRGTHHGNRVTAERWARLIGEAGHAVTVDERYAGQRTDVLVALHARRSADSVRAFADAHADRPIVLALTGTDLYPDLASAGVSADVLELAGRLVVLQPLATEQLPPGLRSRVRVIYQSAEPPPDADLPRVGTGAAYIVVVLSHLRAVKDPLLAAEAARRLPSSSAVQILHYGAVLDPELGDAAREEQAQNPRYQWLGDRPPSEARAALARARLLALTSRDEGGANALSEAIAARVPIVATAIPGSIGILGPDYPAYIPPGDPQELAETIERLERDDAGIYAELERRITALLPLVRPDRERQAWQQLLAELEPL